MTGSILRSLFVTVIWIYRVCPITVYTPGFYLNLLDFKVVIEFVVKSILEFPRYPPKNILEYALQTKGLYICKQLL